MEINVGVIGNTLREQEPQETRLKITSRLICKVKRRRWEKENGSYCYNASKIGFNL
jgi:hypothetical protein